jgi:uncharacterized damage-inducible protein DinB
MSMAAPAALTSRLDTILSATEDLVRSLPDNRIDETSLEPGPSLGELGFHIFRLCLAFIDAVDAGQLHEASLREGLMPDGMREMRTVANYGALVRARIAGWVEGAEAAAFTRTVDTQDGPQSAHELLQHITEQAAQHLRELRALAEGDQRAGGLARP